MPAAKHLQAPAEDDDISMEPGVLTLDSEVAAGVEDWLAAFTSTAENEVTAIRDIPEDDHKDESLATASSYHSKDSHNDAEGEEEVEDEILESVSTVLLKIKNNFNSLNSFLS